MFKDKVNAQSRETYADAWNTAVEKYNTSDSNTKAIDSIQKYVSYEIPIYSSTVFTSLYELHTELFVYPLH